MTTVLSVAGKRFNCIHELEANMSSYLHYDDVVYVMPQSTLASLKLRTHLLMVHRFNE